MLRRRHLSRLTLRLFLSQALPLTLLHLRSQAVDRRFEKLDQMHLKGLQGHEKLSHQRGR